MRRLNLAAGWQLKARDPSSSLDAAVASRDGWLPASVPGTVHQTLVDAGRIPDPFIGRNELDVQWVGERDWLYRCEFEVPADILGANIQTLCFDGLDTFATVWLNGEQILVSDNMFVPHRVPVTHLLREKHNELHIVFESALRRGEEREEEYGVSHVWNGDASRVYVRKAQYHYGWDWGPTLLTAGPWREIRLEAYDARIVHLHCPPEVAADLSHVVLPVEVVVDDLTANATDLALYLTLHDPKDEQIATRRVSVRAGTAQHTFQVDAPQLWWPQGYGEQALYRLTATLIRKDDESELDRQTHRLGLRRLRLVQDPLTDEPGSSFVFEINNTPVFCGGANWIPADSFTPRVTPEHYRKLLELAVDANMTMVRIWGGGIYEEDIFYDICDELGLLVWQDFMFACGLYPAYEEFRASVRAEAEAVVRRLRHHPSLALWCGNNEDYMLADSIGRYDPTVEDDLAASSFPARAIYERLLPEVCAELDPTTPYWPGSPYAGRNPNDGTVGDRHTWDVWHGQMAPYQEYPRLGGRFVSEFGMQALPDLATIEVFTEPAERYPQSRTMDHHNKAEGGPRRLAAYVIDNVRVPADLEGVIYATQFVQAEALGAAIRGWRRQFAGPGNYETSGALIWQLNDCWPVTSWAIIDHALRPKPAYYVVKRELAPIAVGLARTDAGAAVWAVNTTGDHVEGELHLNVWALAGEQRARHSERIALAPHRATELGKFRLDSEPPFIVAAQLLVENQVVSRATLWPEPFKYLSLPEPDLDVERDGEMLRVRVMRPAKGVWLSAGDGVTWSDNMLDLLPGDERVVVARGLGNRSVYVRWLGTDSRRRVC